MLNLSKIKNVLFFSVFLIAGSGISQTANGQVGIDTAAQEIAGFFDSVSNLILAIGGIVGLIGGIRVYIAWNAGDQNVNKLLMGWFGACIFLVVVGVVLKSFFGL